MQRLFTIKKENIQKKVKNIFLYILMESMNQWTYVKFSQKRRRKCIFFFGRISNRIEWCWLRAMECIARNNI